MIRKYQMEEERLRARQYFETEEGKTRTRNRTGKYKRLTRHFDVALREVMDDTEILSLSQIADRIYRTKQVRMKPLTLANQLRRYLDTYGQSPLETANGVNYRLNNGFYAAYRKKSPSPHY